MSPGLESLSRSEARRTAVVVVCVAAVVLAVTAAVGIRWLLRSQRDARQVRKRAAQAAMVAAQKTRIAAQAEKDAEDARARLFAELQPVRLTNCEFERFGEVNDGGYVLCGNLLNGVQTAYSYGISGYDKWGCDVSHRLSVPVHQYDCFDLERPTCPGGKPVFHGECVAGERATNEGRQFDTPEHQFIKNGDEGKRVVVKMDVEGAEWDTLATVPEAVLGRIDQLTIEMHGLDQPERFAAVMRRLKRVLVVANLHFNNYTCREDVAPFPAEVYEVLFVSKRLAVLGGPGPAGAPAALLKPNNRQWSDCQTLADLPQVKAEVRR